MNTIVEMDAIQFMQDLSEPPKLILTDPPYGLNYSTNIPGDKRWNKSGKTAAKFEVLKNDKNLNCIHFDTFFQLCYQKSAENSVMFCFCNDKALAEWSAFGVKAGYEWKDTIVWNKKCANGGDIKWPFIGVVEYILAFVKGKPSFNPLFNADDKLKQRVVNVLDEGRTKKAEHCGHPTQKPLFICEQFIRTATNENDYVVDPFCGSGTSLAAAKRMSRRFDGCDIDPKYVHIASERIAAVTNGSISFDDVDVKA